MPRRVPLARINLFQDRRRAALATFGIGASLLLVLILQAVFAGAMQQVTAYIDASPAEIFISQEGVTTMHMSATALPVGTVERAASVEGVAWAEGLWYTSSLVGADDDRRLTYVFGYDAEPGRAGPQRFAAGRAPRAGEIVIDAILADELDLSIGDDVQLFGQDWTISGLSTGGTNIVNTTVYIDRAEFERVRGPVISYVLVGADPGVDIGDLSTRLRAALGDATVQTREEFSQQEARIVRDMSTDVMAIMTVVGLLIALAVIGLTLYTVTLSKLREFGIMKAIGATPLRLSSVVVTQALWSIALGLLIAVVLAVGLGALITRLTPNVLVVVEPSSVARAGMSAMAVGAVGSIVPLWRVLRVDPAAVFRRAS